MTETSAASRVFAIPELLHEVLSYLPQTCLLSTIPLVCRSWGVALTSPSLERAQWFRPAIHNGPSTWSDLLEKQFGIFFDFNLISNRNVLDSTAFDTLPWKRNLDAFQRADAIWRNMLVFQPPCYQYDRSGIMQQTVILPCPEGLRMGMVWDIAQEWCLRRKHWLQMSGPEVEKEYRNSEVDMMTDDSKDDTALHITCPPSRVLRPV
ncbi:uncharacterized protein EAF02_009549 [Botrytis sinoallii]|uniref:uncharacterized protein n=1 Tax=Botrytis sinoallii TaxID=1463999 RepID=UPI0018FF753A|nr:uncharacterized protein EAF02_009549 [Botrytis sinoallii]KAF7868813.1 hypothetical protein EAF02_009549 [Botrytis sinoallii]